MEEGWGCVCGSPYQARGTLRFTGLSHGGAGLPASLVLLAKTFPPPTHPRSLLIPTLTKAARKAASPVGLAQRMMAIWERSKGRTLWCREGDLCVEGPPSELDFPPQGA